jgi:SAGA-associated factor 29
MTNTFTLLLASQKYFATTIKSIVPLPETTAPRDSPSHPNAYAELPIGSRVAAMYPETSSFYYGTVVVPDLPRKGKHAIMFDDDDGKKTEVEYDLVLDVSVSV